MRTAGLPAFFRSSMSRDSPARAKMTIRASCRRSAEMDRTVESSTSSILGPSTIPVMSIPSRLGSPMRLKRSPRSIPHKKMSAKLISIVGSSST